MGDPRPVGAGAGGTVLRFALTCGLVAVVAAPLTGAGAPAAAGTVTVVATGLDNPRGLALGPGGRIYVAQAGRGGPTCVATGAGSKACFGFTGLVGRLQAGRVTPLVRGLASQAGEDADGAYALGPEGVSVAPDGTVLVVMSAVNCGTPPGEPAAAVAQEGRLLTWRPGRTVTPLADVSRLECTANPDGADRNSHPYAVLALGPRRAVVVDAGANALFSVDGPSVKLLAVLPMNGDSQSVPLAITRGPGGDYYVGELAQAAGGGTARVFRVTPAGRVTVYRAGFSNISGVAFGRDGSLYVTQLSDDLNSDRPSGSVVRVAPDGRRTVLGAGRLGFPAGGVVRGRDLFVSNGSVYPAVTSKESAAGGRGGQLVKIRLPG